MSLVSHFNENLNAETLKLMLKALGAENKPTRKAEIAKELNRIWLRNPRSFLDRLSEPERILLAECVHGDDDTIDVVKLNAKHGFSYTFPYHRSYRDCHFIHCFCYRDRYEGYILVPDMAEQLMDLLPPPPDIKIESKKERPEEGVWTRSYWSGEKSRTKRSLSLYQSEGIAIREVRRVLQLAAAEKLKVSDKTGQPTKPTLDLIGAALGGPELNLRIPEDEDQPWDKSLIDPGPVRAAAWPVIVQQCKWAKPRAGKLILTRSGKSLLDNFTYEKYAEGIVALIQDEKFDEMMKVSLIKGQRGKRTGRFRIAAFERRSAIAETLRELPADEWVELEEAYRVMRSIGLLCHVVTEGGVFYIGDPQYGNLAGREEDIARIYFRQLAGESLATLGLIDLSYTYPHYLLPECRDNWGMDDVTYVTNFDGLKFFRVTALGRFCLGLTEEYTPPETESRALFKVLPNNDIVVTDSAAFSSAEEATLDRFSKRKSDAVWKLDGPSILNALSAGDTTEEILDILRKGSDVEIPATVLRLIQDTEQRASSTTASEKAIILTFRDEETAALIEHDSVAGKAVLCRSEKSLVIREKNFKRFKTRLFKLGILVP